MTDQVPLPATAQANSARPSPQAARGRWVCDALVAIALLGTLAGVYAWDSRQASIASAAPQIAPVADSPSQTPEDLSPPIVELPSTDLAELPPPPEPEPPAAEPPPPPPEITPQALISSPADPIRRVLVQFSEDGRFGLGTTSGDPNNPGDDYQLLTYSSTGTTNNTRLFLDGSTPLVGGDVGRIIRPVTEVADGRTEFEWEFRRLHVTQAVEYAVGDVSRRTDAILVEYRLENQGEDRPRVGLRVMLDSLIGQNDGVPFIVPGHPKLVTSPQTLRGQQVPAFVRALEYENLASPGVIVDLGLRSEGSERPVEVVLAHWPGAYAEYNYEQLAPFASDSSIGLYYEIRPMEHGATRTIRFTYGLGSISSTKTGNTRLSLTAGGPFRAGASFWLVALVQNAQDGQRVTLELPPGLSLADQETAEKRVELGRSYSQISWLVRISPDRAGSAEIKARLEPGDVEEQFDLDISGEQRLLLAPKGPFQCGQPFWVAAVVERPQPGQRLELKLPDELKLAAGHVAEKPVPAGAARAQVKWLIEGPVRAGKVRLAARLLPERLEQESAITIEPGQTKLTLIPKGPFHAGRPFWVVALVQNPGAEQSVELTLPERLSLVKEDAVKPVTAQGHTCQLNWLVRADDDFTGRADLNAQLKPEQLAAHAELNVEPPETRLSLIVKPLPRSNRRFWLVALVQNPRAEQTVELKWTPQLALARGAAKQGVAAGPEGFAQINWLLEAAGRDGGKVEATVVLQPGDVEKRIEVDLQAATLID